MAVDPNTWLIFGIAVLNGGTALLTWHTRREVKETKIEVTETKIAVVEAQKDIKIIEKATNSLTDRLVASTDAAARAETRVTVAAENKAEKDAGLARES